MNGSKALLIREPGEPEQPTCEEIAELRGLESDEVEEFQEITSGKISQESYDRPLQNPAVFRCVCAWNHAIKKEQAKSTADQDVEEAGSSSKSAYLRNMPPLDSPENVRDFIACVAYAEVADVIRHYETVDLLESVKVALAAVRNEQRSRKSEPKRLGRPPKPSLVQEINK